MNIRGATGKTAVGMLPFGDSGWAAEALGKRDVSTSTRNVVVTERWRGPRQGDPRATLHH